MATDRGIMLTKSPFFITELGATGFTSAIEIRVWNGDFNSEPAAATYTLEKQALTINTTVVVYEVAKIINTSFDHVGDIYDLTPSARTEALWVNIKSFGGDTNRDDTWLALDGYSDFTFGLNYQPTPTALISERIIYHYDDIPIRFPVYINTSADTTSVVLMKDGGDVTTYSYSGLLSSDNSYDKIQYVSDLAATGTYDSIELRDNVGVVLDTIVVEPRVCRIHTPYTTAFINRFGINQEFTFPLASREAVSVEKSTYNRQILQIVGGVPSYNTLRHQTKDYNVKERNVVSLNTDYIDESLNITMTELLSSDAVWLIVGGSILPANVSTAGLDYKNNINDGLIQYNMNFSYAFFTRNTVY